MSKAVSLHHQFEDLEQQTHSSTLGMWVFLATEILFFGALFACYEIYRIRWPEAFRHGGSELLIWVGGINTAVLLTSSLFMALAVHSAAHGDNRRLVRYLILTIALGVLFLVFKSFEYYKEYQEHLVPRINFAHVPPHEAHLPPAQQHRRPNAEELFFVFYFCMTGLHAIHMIIGVGVMSWLIWMARRNRFSAEYHNPVEVAGLYWHFVDVVWVFLYPCLYLLRQP